MQSNIANSRSTESQIINQATPSVTITKIRQVRMYMVSNTQNTWLTSNMVVLIITPTQSQAS